MALVVSHLIVRVVKRTVVRGRPAKVERCVNLVREPDRFSFPSGHAAASMSVALAYWTAFPAWATPLLLVAAAGGLLLGGPAPRRRDHSGAQAVGLAMSTDFTFSLHDHGFAVTAFRLLSCLQTASQRCAGHPTQLERLYDPAGA